MNLDKWETTRIHTVDDYYIFNVLRMERRHPLTNKLSDFVVIDSAPWVNVIPITKEKKIIFVKQYRHGIDDITLELPAGLVSENESLQACCLRETLEETGYTTDSEPEFLGVCDANPAFMNNQCSAFLLKDCYHKQEQTLDANELIEVVEIPLMNVPDLILKGEIRHPLVLSAFYWYTLRYGK